MRLVLFLVALLSVSLLQAQALGEGSFSGAERAGGGGGGEERERSAHLVEGEEGGSIGEDVPLVMVGILARNAAHSLENFLGYFESLDYPKHRMALWIRTDHNEDNTLGMLREWEEGAGPLYRSVDLGHEDQWLFADRNPLAMTDERYIHISQLRQQGLEEARKQKAHYLLWMDCDAFLINNQTLRLLVEQRKPVISPVLESGSSQAYSNFWCGQDEQGYYKRTPDYIPILKRERLGCFQVPVVHTAVLIDLRTPQSRGLAYWPQAQEFKGPVDDVVYFAYSAKKGEVDVYVLNVEFFGYTQKTRKHKDLAHVVREFLNFKLKTLVNYPPVLRSQYISDSTPRSKEGLDKIFLISLERRPERRNRMLACLDELKLNYTLFDAVDGRKLNQSYLDGLGITYMPGWKDPWGERPMTFGEVGCFLSHYFIWQKMVEEDLQEVLVLEDDVDFEPDFRENLRAVLEDARKYTPSWDLIYVGRKVLEFGEEKWVSHSRKLVVPRYSYWTLGYLVSLRGARKLLEARPFDSLLPVDEYLPIMFNMHPETDWAAHFTTRNLEAYSARPLLVNPTHYVGDPGWFSDTEPPMEILEKIRLRKVKQEEEEKEEEARRERREKEAATRQEKLKEEALKRQIEAMRAKLKPRAEL